MCGGVWGWVSILSSVLIFSKLTNSSFLPSRAVSDTRTFILNFGKRLRNLKLPWECFPFSPPHPPLSSWLSTEDELVIDHESFQPFFGGKGTGMRPKYPERLLTNVPPGRPLVLFVRHADPNQSYVFQNRTADEMQLVAAVLICLLRWRIAISVLSFFHFRFVETTERRSVQHFVLCKSWLSDWLID